MFASRITLALVFSLFSGIMFAGEPEKPSKILVEMLDVLSHAVGAEEVLAGGSALVLSKSNEAEVELLLGSSPNKPDKIEKDIFPGGRFKFIQAYYPSYFTVYYFGNKVDKWKGTLYSTGFTLRRPGPEVHPEESDIYNLIESMHGSHNRAEKFMSRFRTHADLMNYIWVLDDLVVVYRGFHDLKRGDNVFVVKYWDRAFFESHNYKNY